jgi:hypothetical protein
MSALTEQVKRLIDMLPDDAVLTLLEDVQDALDLEEAIEKSDPKQAVQLLELLRKLKAEGHPAAE